MRGREFPLCIDSDVVAIECQGRFVSAGKDFRIAGRRTVVWTQEAQRQVVHANPEM